MGEIGERNKRRQRKGPEWTVTKNRMLYGEGKGIRRDDLQNVFKRLKTMMGKTMISGRIWT